MVRDGRCELGFTDAADLASGLTSHPLADQDYVAILPPKTSLPKGRRKLSLEKIVEYAAQQQLIPRRFEVDELPPAHLKGKEKPLRIFNVKREKVSAVVAKVG